MWHIELKQNTPTKPSQLHFLVLICGEHGICATDFKNVMEVWAPGKYEMCLEKHPAGLSWERVFSCFFFEAEYGRYFLRNYQSAPLSGSRAWSFRNQNTKKNTALRSLDWKRLDMGWGFNVSFLISRAFWWPGWPAGWICIFLVGAPGPIVGSVSSMLRLVWLICLIGWKPLQRQVEQFFNMLGNLHVFCTWKKGVSCRTTLPRELPFAPIEEVCLQRVHSVGRMDISWFFWRRPGSFWAQSCGGQTCGTASERENFCGLFLSKCGFLNQIVNFV